MYWYWYFTLLLFNRWHYLSYIHLQNFCDKKYDFNEKLFFLPILDATVTCTLFTKYFIDHWFMVILLSIWSLKNFLSEILNNIHIHVHVLYLSILLFLCNVNDICNLWIKNNLWSFRYLFSLQMCWSVQSSPLSLQDVLLCFENISM